MITWKDLMATLAAIALVFAAHAGDKEKFTSNTTLTWEECIDAYRQLDLLSEDASLSEIGVSDGGHPIHLFIINSDRVFAPENFDRKKTIVFINNAIHPGEPDGVDASLGLCRDLLIKGEGKEWLKKIILCIIPIYNVDGAINRGSFSRANQNGPESYGFRASAKNLDLNRDFIKCDSRNTQAFTQIFNRLNPEVMVDTHVSNGADYPYTMTLITTQCDKLGGPCGNYIRDVFEPALFDAMKKSGDPMSPYVNTMGRTPESGLLAFNETARFATGYAALFNTFGFTTETHMLKPFAERVESTWRFLICLLDYVAAHAEEINQIKRDSDAYWMKQKEVPLAFEVDTARASTFRFQGYTAASKKAEVGSGERLYYDHNKPWETDIPYYRNFKVKHWLKLPEAYIVPQAWTAVMDLLRNNHVQCYPLEKDSIIEVEIAYVDDFSSPSKPYEGHYLHEEVRLRKEVRTIRYFKGDWIIPLNQPAFRYVATCLEPESGESFFTWNFFDSVLQQKEWFSDYVFEEKAAELLRNDPQLRASFEKAMQEDSDMAASHWSQLYWIYKHSPYYEQTAFRYPVARIPRKD